MELEYDGLEDRLIILLSSEKADRLVEVDRVSIGYYGNKPVSIQINGGLDFIKSAMRAYLGVRGEGVKAFAVKMQSFSIFLKTAAERRLSAIAVGLMRHGRFLLAVFRGKPVGGLYTTSRSRLKGEHAIYRILRDIRRERGSVRVVLCSSALIQQIASLQGEIFTGLLPRSSGSVEVAESLLELTASVDSKVICFLSATDGASKTTTLVNTGAMLAAMGRRVLIVDANIPSSTASLMLEHRARRYLNTLLKPVGYREASGRRRYGGIPSRWLLKYTGVVTSASPAAGLLSILPSNSEIEIDPTLLIDVLLELADMNEYEYILVDTPLGVSQLAIAAAIPSDLLVAVATPDTPHVQVREMLTLAKKLDVKMGLAVIHTSPVEHQSLYPLDSLEDIDFTVLIPHAPEAIKYLREGGAYAIEERGSGYSKAIGKLARSIVEATREG